MPTSPFSRCLLVFIFLILIHADKRQEKIRQETAEASGATGSAGPTRHPTEEMDIDGGDGAEEGVPGNKDKDKEKGSGGKEKEKEGGGKDGKEGKDGHTPSQAHPPAKRYRLTEAMKSIIWELVVLSNECCRLENEKK